VVAVHAGAPADQLDGSAILAMHDALLGPSRPDWAGRWRDQQVWIGASNYGPFDAHHVAPTMAGCRRQSTT
jgi:hypothetical protein